MPEVIAKQDHNAIVNWDGFSELPKEGLDYLLDTTALNKKLADRKESPYRWRTGSFQVPSGITGEMLKKACKAAIDKWITVFSKQGWELASKVQVYNGQSPAYDILAGVPILDRREMKVRAIFKTNPKPVRIYLPDSSVRQHKDQKSNLADVLKGEGILAVPRHKRPIK